MTPDRPPSDSGPLRDPRFDAEWRALSREEPPDALDARILAAAHRAVGAGPQRADVREATRPERWWWPLAAAASIGAVAFGILQVIGPDQADVPLAERAVVSDGPMQQSSPPAPAMPGPTESARQRDTRADEAPAPASAPAPPSTKPAPKPAPVAPPLAKRAPITPPMPAAVPEPAPAAPAALGRDAAGPREAAGESVVGGVATAPAPSATPAAAFRAEAQRKTAAPLAIDAWLERIRRLRAEGRTDELAREIAAFRAAYPAEEKRLQEELARPLPPRE